MKRSTCQPVWTLGLGVLLSAILTAGAALAAEVIIEQKVTSSGFGGMGESEGMSKIHCSADRERTETTTQMNGMMAKLAGGPIQSVNITRLDRELIWEINAKDKTYTEMTFAEMRAMLADAKAKLAEAGKKVKGTTPAEDVKLEGNVQVERTGKQETICGIACEQVVMTMTTAATDPRTGQQSTQYMVADLWLAKSFPGSEVYKAYSRAFVEKAGVGDMARGMEGANPYATQMAQLAEKTQGIEGTPLRERISIEVASTGFTGTAEGGNGATDGATAGETAGARDEESSASGGKRRFDLGSLMKKKAAVRGAGSEASGDAAAGQAHGEGRQVMFAMTTEMTRIETGDVPAAMFEVPAGYKKIEQKHRQPSVGGTRTSD